MADPSPRVLFVEAEDGKRHAIVPRLRAAGFEVTEVASGAEGLARLSPELDIAIIGMRLPDLHGSDVCRRIKEDPQTASIMVLELADAAATAADRARGLELGADACLGDQVELVELIATLRALHRLRRAERERERHRELFLGTVGHDLRNPLQTIVTATQVLAESRTLIAPERRTVATIERTADRMRRLIDQLLIFTQGVAGGVPIRHEAVDLAELGRAVAREHADGRAIAIDDQLATPIAADAERMTQLIDNLITNALRYGSGTVTLRLARDGDTAVLTVHNHGTPIPALQLATLFDPYKRAARTHGGVGLGLYIVEQIARAHGGTVQVASTAEAGTAFEVRIPIG
jgi:signal transduction histidine kinase